MMSGCQNVHPTVLAAIYGSVGLIWLCGGIWLINIWIDDPTVAFFASLLQQSLFVAASAGLIYWLRRPAGADVEPASCPLAPRMEADATPLHNLSALQQTEEHLRRANDELETRVRQRIAELTAINDALEAQISARIQAETALRDSEEQFRQLAEHIREVFWVHGVAEERLLYVSPAYADIWGRPAQSFQERPLDWLEAIHPDDRDRVHTAHIVKLGTGFLNEEYRIIRPDGTVRWIWDRGFPIRDATGYVYRIAGLAEDITTRKMAEDQLRRQQVELAKTARLSLAIELASNLAHELNQPLAAIVAYTQACLALLRQDQTDPRALTGTLESVVNQGLRAGEIIRHLRDLVRKHPSAQTTLDLNALIGAVVHYAQLELHQAQVTVRLQLAESLPVIVADDLQIQLVVLYLMRNAIEAMNESADGPRELTLRTALLKENTVLTTIHDTGQGLGAATLEKLFQAFFTTKPNNIGLGLSVSRSIIESQNGELWATPNPDRGMSFHFTLPVCGHLPGFSHP
jgi:two-component system sensor kinase FixL